MLAIQFGISDDTRRNTSLEVSLVNVMSRETVLRPYIEIVKESYDYILIDCLCGYPHKQSNAE